MRMDWNVVANVAGPVVALIAGGIFGSRKRKADTHAVVVTNATDFAASVNARYDAVLRRLDEMEDRENRRDDLARAHLRWDWGRVRQLADLGVEVPDPPPLFLYPDDLTKKG